MRTYINVCLLFLFIFPYDSVAWLKMQGLFKKQVPRTEDFIRQKEYEVEIHQIRTEDDYYLSLHRIPPADEQRTNKFPVFLMHGLLGSSADWVCLNRGLAYSLAADGYDVWLGNARGTVPSKNATKYQPRPKLKPNFKDYYDFSWHEIGYYDVAASIDYILESTGHSKLNYIGHSQGCTSFIVLMSTRPEYNEKVEMAVLLAPAVIFEHMPPSFVKSAAPFFRLIKKFTENLRIYQVPYVELMEYLGYSKSTSPLLYPVYKQFSKTKFGKFQEFEDIDLKNIAANTPAGASLKQIGHYAQVVLTGRFAQYDYGVKKNKEIYGLESSPLYNLSLVSTKIAAFFSRNDVFIDLRDAASLINNLPNVVHYKIVPDNNFTHFDFLYGKNVQEVLHTSILEVMNIRNKKHNEL